MRCCEYDSVWSRHNIHAIFPTHNSTYKTIESDEVLLVRRVIAKDTLGISLSLLVLARGIGKQMSVGAWIDGGWLEISRYMTTQAVAMLQRLKAARSNNE